MPTSISSLGSLYWTLYVRVSELQQCLVDIDAPLELAHHPTSSVTAQNLQNVRSLTWYVGIANVYSERYMLLASFYICNFQHTTCCVFILIVRCQLVTIKLFDGLLVNLLCC